MTHHDKVGSGFWHCIIPHKAFVILNRSSRAVNTLRASDILDFKRLSPIYLLNIMRLSVCGSTLSLPKNRLAGFSLKCKLCIFLFTAISWSVSQRFVGLIINLHFICLTWTTYNIRDYTLSFIYEYDTILGWKYSCKNSFRFIDFDGVEVILESRMHAITSVMRRNVIIIEHTANVVFVGFAG